MTQRQRINISSGRPLEAKAHYSRALRLGELVMQSGTTAIDRKGNVAGEGNIGVQVDAIMDLARESMGAALGRFEDVVRARLYITDPSLVEDAGRAFARYFGDVKPAITLVPIARLARPAQLIEIELEAIDGAETRAEHLSIVGSPLAEIGGSDAVRMDDRIFISGLRAGRMGSADEELRAILRHFRDLLVRSGSSFEDLVYTKSFLPELAESDAFCKAFASELGEVRPVGSLLGAQFIDSAPGRFIVEGEAVIGAAGTRRDLGNAPAGPFAESVGVGDRIYLSLQHPLDRSGEVVATGDWAAQFDRCMERLEEALGSAGASLKDVITRRIFTHTDAEQNRPYGEGPAWFEATRPVALGCRVPEHVHPDYSVCLEAVAVRGAGESIEWRTLEE